MAGRMNGWSQPDNGDCFSNLTCYNLFTDYNTLHHKEGVPCRVSQVVHCARWQVGLSEVKSREPIIQVSHAMKGKDDGIG